MRDDSLLLLSRCLCLGRQHLEVAVCEMHAGATVVGMACDEGLSTMSPIAERR
jgi:hypothetical protein